MGHGQRTQPGYAGVRQTGGKPGQKYTEYGDERDHRTHQGEATAGEAQIA